MATDMTVAHTIQEQLGGRALMMLGASQLLGDEKSLMFSIKGSPNCNKIKIELADDDTYTVTFWKGRGLKWRTVAEVEMVYVDSLHRTIETHTGLYTSMGTMGR